MTVDLPALTADIAALHRDMASALVDAGLFPKEAAAMIETWRDSWFEEGMRIFYILPRAAVDSVLPLKITPAPSNTVRVFVGRVEVLSPAMQQSLRTALAAGDTASACEVWPVPRPIPGTNQAERQRSHFAGRADLHRYAPGRKPLTSGLRLARSRCRRYRRTNVSVLTTEPMAPFWRLAIWRLNSRQFL